MSNIFMSLPVKDLKKAVAFWNKIGYSFNPQFTGDDAACLLFSEHNFVMLLTHEKFKQFSPLPIADTTKCLQALFGLSCESRADVQEKVRRALDAGAKRHGEPEDHGFMYQDSFIDLDGHGWAMTYMDPLHET